MIKIKVKKMKILKIKPCKHSAPYPGAARCPTCGHWVAEHTFPNPYRPDREGETITDGKPHSDAGIREKNPLAELQAKILDTNEAIARLARQLTDSPALPSLLANMRSLQKRHKKLESDFLVAAKRTR